MIRAVTFDFWNTLVAEDQTSWKRRLEAQRAALSRVGVERSPEELEAATLVVREWFDLRWRSNDVVDPDIGAARMVEVLGLETNSPAVAELAAVYRAGSDPATISPAPGIGDALEALRADGVVIGIICDAGFAPGETLRGYLRHHGLLDFFSHWTFSDEVRWFKPDRRMFEHAARGLGAAEPSELAHVGDLRRTDVAGAVAAGWTAVRYRGLNDDAPDEADPDDADHVIDHHDALRSVLQNGG